MPRGAARRGILWVSVWAVIAYLPAIAQALTSAPS